MKRAISILALVAMGVVGCNKNKTSDVPASASVTDLSTPAPVATHQPAPAAIQPVVYDAPVMASPVGGGSGSTISGGSYTVKKGDTLYGIARNRYGDGKQWSKIASANPGLRPETLKVGQTITLP